MSRLGTYFALWIYSDYVLLAVIQMKLILLTLFCSHNVKVLKPTSMLSLLPTLGVSALLYLEQKDLEQVGSLSSAASSQVRC